MLKDIIWEELNKEENKISIVHGPLEIDKSRLEDDELDFYYTYEDSGEDDEFDDEDFDDVEFEYDEEDFDEEDFEDEEADEEAENEK